MEISFLRYLSLILLFITISAESDPSDVLIPNYDLPELKVKVYEIKFPLVLSCNVTIAQGDAELTWEKNGTDVKNVESLKGRFKIINDEQSFIIDKTTPEDDGLYSCVYKSFKKDIIVVAQAFVHLPANTGVVEGEKLSIHCNAKGTDLDIVWTIGSNMTIKETTGRYILKEDDNKIRNAKLIIEKVVLEDRGEFTCNATNIATKLKKYNPASDTTLVRVKGKLAALWPFLGICAEVFILCGIILIYEKRRNKTELEESDTDPNTEQEKLKVEKK